MSKGLSITGIGAVSPAGWGVAPMMAALLIGLPLRQRQDLRHPGGITGNASEAEHGRDQGEDQKN